MISFVGIITSNQTVVNIVVYSIDGSEHSGVFGSDYVKFLLLGSVILSPL